MPQWKGALVTTADLLVLVGTIPSTGVLEITAPAPAIPGREHIAFFGQGLFSSATDGINLGSPSLGILIDSRF